MAEQQKKQGGLLTPLLVTFSVLTVLFIAPFGVGAQYFRAPSGSMQPTIMRGDSFVATKWDYGYGRYSSLFTLGVAHGRIFARATPQRGDVVVFRPPTEPDRSFVKRVIGLPGDRVQMIDGVLNINGAPVQTEALGEVSFDDDGMTIHAQSIRETLPGGVSYVVYDRDPRGELDNTRVFVVPDNSYFLMGDDRDNSADSRTVVVGYVPLENFVGRVAWIAHARPSAS